MTAFLEAVHDALIVDEAEGLYVRPVAPDDADALFELVASNSYLHTYQRWTRGYTREKAQQDVKNTIELIEEGEWSQYRIMRQSEPAAAMIGTITLYDIDPDAHSAFLGYYIAEQEQGKGIVTRASRRVLEHARDEHDLRYALLEIEVGNLASEHVARRLGAQLTEKIHTDKQQIERRIWEAKL